MRGVHPVSGVRTCSSMRFVLQEPWVNGGSLNQYQHAYVYDNYTVRSIRQAGMNELDPITCACISGRQFIQSVIQICTWSNQSCMYMGHAPHWISHTSMNLIQPVVHFICSLFNKRVIKVWTSSSQSCISYADYSIRESYKCELDPASRAFHMQFIQ